MKHNRHKWVLKFSLCIALEWVGVAAASPAGMLQQLDQSQAQPRFAVAMDDMELIGPFKSWVNVKQFGAVGNGIVDDTAALQKAINALTATNNQFAVLYIPAGHYRITQTLNMMAVNSGREIIGEDPSTTEIVWTGPVGDPMLVVNGGFNSRFSRLTWNGRSKAGYGIAHWWNSATNPYLYGGSVEHTDEVFEDMGIGIMAGRLGENYGNLDSEGQVRRVTFLRNSLAAFDVGSWNALDWWIWDSHFVDNARGLSNLYTVGDNSGAGGFYAYRSVFERSSVADVNIANTNWYAMHENVSRSSRRFFQAEGMGANGCNVILEGNRIINPQSPIVVSNGNLGPVTLLDNQIQNPTGSPGPVVQMNDWQSGRDVVSIGNQYTIANVIQVPEPGVDRVRQIDDQQVLPDSISDRLPSLPATPQWQSRAVFEVPAGADSAKIQSVINAAVASGQYNVIVHFAPGSYTLKQTLVVPANVPIQLAGDGLGATLWWAGNGTGPMIQLQGPSRATLRDLELINNDAIGISITNADQPGGRIFIMGSFLAPLTAANLTQTAITAQANTSLGGLDVDNVHSFVSIGLGGIGKVRLHGAPSNVLLNDSWYEGQDSDMYRMQSGQFTFMGGVLAPASHQPATDPYDPAILLDQFNGMATFYGVGFDLTHVPTGIGMEVDHAGPATNALFMSIGASNSQYLALNSQMGAEARHVGLVMSKGVANGLGVSVPDQGNDHDSLIIKGLAQQRALAWDRTPYAAPQGATDVRLYRLKAVQLSQGVRINVD